MAVALATFLVSAVVTHWAEAGARHLTANRGWQVALITAAFLAVSAVFFVVKFVTYETVVFTKVTAPREISRRCRLPQRNENARQNVPEPPFLIVESLR